MLWHAQLRKVDHSNVNTGWDETANFVVLDQVRDGPLLSLPVSDRLVDIFNE